MQTVGLEDEVSVGVSVRGGVRLVCEDPSVPTDERNLVVRAAAAVLARAGVRPQERPGLELHLVKRIPVSAGLGGGSSDAAATIVALNALLGLGWSREVMLEVGASVGSDVPFFFFAPSAVVRGRGEQVAPLTVRGSRWLLLVHPGFPIATRWAYEELAAARAGIQPLSQTLSRIERERTVSWEELVMVMENDFDALLVPRYPVLAHIKRELKAAGAEAVLLSGSGATVFGVFQDETAAARARQAINRREGWCVCAVPAGTGALECETHERVHPVSAS
jgi:4-diphosphocytidyl-2-C-methyl-D-erythritol kinase